MKAAITVLHAPKRFQASRSMTEKLGGKLTQRLCNDRPFDVVCGNASYTD
jgi:uncharacterized protein with GYD domain